MIDLAMRFLRLPAQPFACPSMATAIRSFCEVTSSVEGKVDDGPDLGGFRGSSPPLRNGFQSQANARGRILVHSACILANASRLPRFISGAILWRNPLMIVAVKFLLLRGLPFYSSNVYGRQLSFAAVNHKIRILDNFRPLVMALSNKHPACVKLLAPLTARASFTRAVSVAVGQGGADAVAALLAAGRLGHDKLPLGIEPLGLAALFGHARIIELLIPVCDPKKGNSLALK